MIGTFGIKELDDCSELLGTDDAPFNKYPDVTGLRRICNTGTTAWPPNTLIDSGGMLYWVPNWLENPVLSGEKVVVGIAEPRESAPISELRDEPGKLKAARQPPPASSVPSPPPPSRTGVRSRLRRFWHWLVSLCFCSCPTSPAAVYPTDWPAGEPPPSPPPAPPDGSDCSDSDEDEAVDPEARNGLSAQSKRGAMTPQQRALQRADQQAKKARGEASRSLAMLPKTRRATGSSSGVGTNKRSKTDTLAPPSRSEAESVEGEAGAVVGEVAVGEAADGDGEAAGGEADAAVGEAEVDVGEEEEAEEIEAEGESEEEVEESEAAAADEGITPEKGLEALKDACGLFELKSKVESLPFAPLKAATRAADFGSVALTSSSSREDIEAACKSLASKLDSLKNLGDFKTQRAKLMRMLKWPSSALLDAFAKELRAGEGGAAGGVAAQATDALLAARRIDVARLVIKHTEATGESACAKMKELFRQIRSVWPNVLTELEP